MTATIHLEFEGKSARLPLQTPKKVKVEAVVQRRTSAGAVNLCRIFKALSDADPARMSVEELVAGDPELDFSLAGVLAEPDLLSPVYLNQAGEPVRDFEELELVLAADGTEKERRPKSDRVANINDVRPVKVTKTISLDQALTSFVFRAVLQIVHSDGLEHDFLLGLARKLHEQRVVALLGAGPKGNLPLILKEKGSPYRAFLYGEARPDDTYRLLVLLSNQELKLPS